MKDVRVPAQLMRAMAAEAEAAREARAKVMMSTMKVRHKLRRAARLRQAMESWPPIAGTFFFRDKENEIT